MHLILKIGISQDTECFNMVGFPKLGHIFERIILELWDTRKHNFRMLGRFWA